MVIVINKDIVMSPGKMAVQVAHAAVDCAFKASRKKHSIVDSWFNDGQKKVVVKATKDDIEILEKKAASMGLTVTVIRDAGLTELEPGTLTAMALGPSDEHIIDRVTGQLPLK